MKISQKFEQFVAEWDMDKPETVLIDAFDLTYDADTCKLIEFVSEISKRKKQMEIEGI